MIIKKKLKKPKKSQIKATKRNFGKANCFLRIWMDFTFA